MNNKVEVISTSGCGKCRLLKQWMDIKDIEYTERNISYDAEAVQILREAGLKSLPQVMIDGKVVEYKEYNDILPLLDK